MIFDHIENYNKYRNCSHNIHLALEFLYTHKDNLLLSDGEYTVKDNEVIAYVVSKNTIPRTDARLEIHKKYIDIHYILKDMEICGISPMMEEKIGEFDEDNDIAFLEIDKDPSHILARKGDFYIVWPNEPHRPLCAVDKPGKTVRKIIIKVKV